jgi:hypothetical protein
MTPATRTDPGVETTETLAPEGHREPEKITVLEALATHVARTGPNMSNQTTAPRNTDYDDQ